MHKIGVISDTHGLLRPEVITSLQGCEAILHGGDFDNREILKKLEGMAPVYAVQGNNDYWSERETALPETLTVELYGLKFFMIHDRKMITGDLSGFHVILYGHSHKYEEKYSGKQLWLNPGSCGPKRFRLPVTMAIIEIDENGNFQVERIDLEKGTDSGFWGRKEKPSPGMKKTIELIMKDTQKGVPVSKMARRHGISRELAEQICRLYLTHPGVDADGIMRKMGL